MYICINIKRFCFVSYGFVICHWTARFFCAPCVHGGGGGMESEKFGPPTGYPKVLAVMLALTALHRGQ